jgi:hypothetical protein
LRVERRDVVGCQAVGQAEALQRADGAGQFGVDQNRLGVRGLQQAPFDGLAVVRDDAPHQEPHDRQRRHEGSDDEQQQMGAQRERPSPARDGDRHRWFQVITRMGR